MLYNRYKARPPGEYWCRRGFPRKKLPPDCAFCTENLPGDETEQIKKKICVFSKKHLPNARRCDRISLGCKGLVRYKSCRPAICVDAGGCHPAIAAMGYFRGVCPILEPGERITDSDGIRSPGRATCETGGTNVRIRFANRSPGELPSGSPVFLVPNRGTPGTV